MRAPEISVSCAMSSALWKKPHLRPASSAYGRTWILSHSLLLRMHPEGQIVMGPFGKDTDAIFPGTKEEKIKFGTERMIKTAQAASALEVPVATGFIGCENFGRFFPWPYSKGWSDMEEEFVERWGKILDRFAEYGVKFAHEPHPNELAYNVESALRAVELMGSRKEFGFNFDPANLIYLGIDVENFIDALAGKIYHVHAKDGEIVAHNVRRSGLIPQGDWQRLSRGFRFRIPGWGDLYASVRDVVDQLERQALKHKEKRKERKKKPTRRAPRAKSPGESEPMVRRKKVSVEEAPAPRVRRPRIVRSPRYRLKPLTPDDALLELETTEDAILVYRDAETYRVNVIYRRRDGVFGLIDPEF